MNAARMGDGAPVVETQEIWIEREKGPVRGLPSPRSWQAADPKQRPAVGPAAQGRDRWPRRWKAQVLEDRLDCLGCATEEAALRLALVLSLRGELDRFACPC